MLFDQMIGSGCVSKVIAAWVGNVIMGVGYNLRRAIEEEIPNRIEIEDYTNFSIALALHAGALGIPFIPTKTAARYRNDGREYPFQRDVLSLYG